MAGGFFSGGTSAPARLDSDSGRGVTYESSPGGFFDGGADPQTTASASTSANDAREYAEDARGWAVGPTTEPLSGWSATNNSKYYSQQSANSASQSAASAAAAAGSASRAENAETAAEAARDLALQYRNQAEVFRNEAEAAANEADSDSRDARNAAFRAEQAAERADSDATRADQAANRADASATAAATSAANARTAELAAENAEAAAERARDDAQLYRDQARVADSDARVQATNAAASAATADSDAYAARTWAVGPGTGPVGHGTATNNAMYWALRAERAGDLDTVQFDFIWNQSHPGLTYANRTVTITDSDLYISDDPIVSYNGVVLSDSDHYTWTETSITFQQNVGVETGDCITVTAGAERTSTVMTTAAANPASPVAGQFYFNTGDNTLRIYNGTAWRSITTA